MIQYDETNCYVEEVLQQVPSWYERWGIIMIGVFAVIISVASWYIKFPDVISARVTISTIVPPTKIHTRNDGRIINLLPENTKVKKDDITGIIENSAHPEDVRKLQKLLAGISLMINDPYSISRYEFPDYLLVGEIQEDYSEFCQVFSQYQQLIKTEFFRNKNINNISQIEKLNLLQEKLNEQQEWLKKEVTVYYGKVKSDSSLFYEKVIAGEQYQKSRAEYYQKLQLLEDNKISIERNSLEKLRLMETLLMNDHQQNTQRQQLYFSLMNNYRKLRSKIDWWENKYLLKAPIEGVLVYLNRLSERQFIHINDALFMVVPVSGTMTGFAELSVKGSGKVELGQKVRISLDNYPSHTYGMLDGVVTSVSLVPSGQTYNVSIKLTHNLITDFGNQLPFRQNVQGVAQIITEDLNLFERIFQNFFSLIKQQF